MATWENNCPLTCKLHAQHKHAHKLRAQKVMRTGLWGARERACHLNHMRTYSSVQTLLFSTLLIPQSLSCKLQLPASFLFCVYVVFLCSCCLNCQSNTHTNLPTQRFGGKESISDQTKDFSHFSAKKYISNSFKNHFYTLIFDYVWSQLYFNLHYQGQLYYSTHTYQFYLYCNMTLGFTICTTYNAWIRSFVWIRKQV